MTQRMVGYWGSCLSRDCCNYLSTSEQRVSFYIARQSLISTFAPATTLELKREPLQSAFQESRVSADIASSACADVQDAETPDLILWDMVDERFGVIALPDGSFLTPSHEATAAGLTPDAIAGSRLIPLGTPEHLALYEAALRDFKDFLVTQGLFERTLLLAPTMAATSWEFAEHRDANPSPDEVAAKAHRLNAAFGPMVAAARALGFAQWSPATEDWTYSPQQRWGTAPFHFCPPFYDAVRSEIEHRLGLGAPITSSRDFRRRRVRSPHVLQGDGTLRLAFEQRAARLTVTVRAESREAHEGQVHLLIRPRGGETEIPGFERTPLGGWCLGRTVRLGTTERIVVDLPRPDIIDAVEVRSTADSPVLVRRLDCRLTIPVTRVPLRTRLKKFLGR